MSRQINEAGLTLIKHFEGCRLNAYNDGAGFTTIGYGHRHNVDTNAMITEDEAISLLKSDLLEWEEFVNKECPNATDNQFSALVALCFNCGNSPIHGHLGEYTKQGLIGNAADEFLKWNHAGGKVMEGLTRRREAERSLFLSKQ